MRLRRWPVLAAVLAPILAAAGTAGAAERLAGPVRADVLEVVDGDTLRVRAHIWLGQTIELLVRIRGIDAPELRGRCGDERALAAAARRALGLSLAGSEVTLQDIEADKYHGRVVADVGGPGADLADALRRSGLVRDYAGGRRLPWCPDPPQMNGR